MIPVVIDARRLQDQPFTGVGRWLANLLPFLARRTKLVLLTDRRRAVPNQPYDKVALGGIGGLPEPAWLHVSVGRWLRGFDGVFHGTYNALPFGYRGPSVLSIYDLSWENHPEDFSPARRLAFSVQARSSAKRASVIVTISEHARRSILDGYRMIDPARVVIAPPGIDPVFSPTPVGALQPVLDEFHIREPYIVAIGGARRRGLEVAIEAWRRLTPDAGSPQLVVVGAEPPPASPGLVHVGRVNDATWATLLAGATLFCYPTRFEGFGMPALEALASGVPVVCARVGPLPEVLGDAAEWCDLPNAEQVGAAMQRLLEDPLRHAALRAAGLRKAAASVTWEQSAAIVADAYQTACE